MDDFDLMPGSTKGGPPKKTVYYQYSGPHVVDETIKDPTPTGKYNQPKKNKNTDSDMYVDEEIYDMEVDNTENNGMNIKKIIIISVVVFIIIFIIIIAVIIFIVMKNKKNNKNEKKKKIQEK
jgi:ATP-dependent Zn protease